MEFRLNAWDKGLWLTQAKEMSVCSSTTFVFVWEKAVANKWLNEATEIVRDNKRHRIEIQQADFSYKLFWLYFFNL